ncbi:MAG TPA: N-acetylglucosamine-6-phosphate deacetylase [Oligoflexus sp.]|uniref:N-acetylglucosamine-6-phosphate deacetylase n=1 Tax=Oligoflexus sp. TaxID=1971216 RepID=UPI002D5CDAF3|nr:N-acetylglucosamine-6-phosphate deacetylase [Oligoflexus sp.]HYX38885.1 N-acetylglucosamine-6-phosphate deacetylase [Oligoflexus sp.]
MTTLQGRILTAQGWMTGAISFDRHIHSMERRMGVSDAKTIIPGFIDLHVHGGQGADVMEGLQAIGQLARWHAGHGTTSLLATTMSASVPELKQVLSNIHEASQMPHAGGARVLGAHLEGPFINRNKRGAHPLIPMNEDPSRDILDLCDSDIVRVITLAPETIQNRSVLNKLASRGIRVQLGHSTSSYEEATAALQQGASGFTHLFNAMSGLHHRDPGMVGAAFAQAEYAEIIPDLFHVHRGAMLAAFRAIPKLYCVTDASAASGMPDGTYPLGCQKVFKCPNGVCLEDGTIAGSILTMDQALKNLLEIGLDLEDAIRRLSLYPAEYLGLKDRGRLQVGAFADLIVLDANGQLEQVYGEGVAIEPSHG